MCGNFGVKMATLASSHFYVNRHEWMWCMIVEKYTRSCSVWFRSWPHNWKEVCFHSGPHDYDYVYKVAQCLFAVYYLCAGMAVLYIFYFLDFLFPDWIKPWRVQLISLQFEVVICHYLWCEGLIFSLPLHWWNPSWGFLWEFILCW